MGEALQKYMEAGERKTTKEYWFGLLNPQDEPLFSRLEAEIYAAGVDMVKWAKTDEVVAFKREHGFNNFGPFDVMSTLEPGYKEGFTRGGYPWLTNLDPHSEQAYKLRQEFGLKSTFDAPWYKPSADVVELQKQLDEVRAEIRVLQNGPPLNAGTSENARYDELWAKQIELEQAIKALPKLSAKAKRSKK